MAIYLALVSVQDNPEVTIHTDSKCSIDSIDEFRKIQAKSHVKEFTKNQKLLIN